MSLHPTPSYTLDLQLEVSLHPTPYTLDLPAPGTLNPKPETLELQVSEQALAALLRAMDGAGDGHHVAMPAWVRFLQVTHKP